MNPAGFADHSPGPARWPRILFGLSVFIAFVWWAGPHQLLAVLTAARPLPIVGALLLSGLAMLCRIARWRALLRHQGARLGFRLAARAYGLGMLAGALTPGRVGQHIKATTAARCGLSWERALAGSLVDQLLDVAVTVLMIPVACGYLGAAVTGSTLWGGAVLGVFAVGLFAMSWRRRGPLASLLREVRALSRPIVGWPLVMTLCAFALYLGSVILIGRGLGIGIDSFKLVFATVASAVAEAAPITIAGLGTREVALYALLRPLSAIEPGTIAALTTAIRLIHFATGGVAWATGEPAIKEPAVRQG